VHRNTAFCWHHRFLDWVKLDRAPQLKGIVKPDEMFLLQSQTGARKLDRRGVVAALPCGAVSHAN
jgi:hypothetical protein